MPLSLSRGVVTAIVQAHEELIRLEVDGVACIAYPRLTGPVEVGDEVVVNVQARALGLGSGGFDVLHANLTRGIGLPADDGAHVINLPYTSVQHAVRHVEEAGPLAETLAGLPVVCCSLHSQVVRYALRSAACGSRTSSSPAVRCPCRSPTPCASCARAVCSTSRSRRRRASTVTCRR